jgi:two-component system response regulator NreC
MSPESKRVFTLTRNEETTDCRAWKENLTSSRMAATSVLLADDHALVRQGLKAILEKEGFQVVGEAADGQDTLRLALQTQPDVAVIDISMPILNGIDVAREIRKCSPKTKVILLTQHDEDLYVTAALRARVKGYLLKKQASADLIHAVREVCRGGVYLSPGISHVVVDACSSETNAPPDPLSGRERQVLQLVCEGKSTRDVAQLLGISVKTVESHRARLMQKLDIHETASLVLYGVRQGLIQP